MWYSRQEAYPFVGRDGRVTTSPDELRAMYAARLRWFRVQGARVNTDNNMYVEFNGPRDMVLAVGPETFDAVEGRASPIEDVLTDPAVLLGSRERLERFVVALRKLEKPTDRYERVLATLR